MHLFKFIHPSLVNLMSSGTYKDMHSGLQSSQHRARGPPPAAARRAWTRAAGASIKNGTSALVFGARLGGAETRGGGVQMLSSSDGGIAGI